MKLYRAALKALEACEIRDEALARREALWSPSKTTAWDQAQDAYVKAFYEALGALDEYRAVRDACPPVQCRRLNPMQ